MPAYGPKSDRYVGLFLLGLVVFNFPILALVNKSRLFLGFPLLYLFLFTGWLVFIVLIALCSAFSRKDPFIDG